MGCFSYPGAIAAISVCDLKRILSQLDDDMELTPNTRGNLAVCEFGPTSDGTRETRWYIGYVDMVAGEAHVNPGARPGDERPGDPQENLSGADTIYVDWNVAATDLAEVAG